MGHATELVCDIRVGNWGKLGKLDKHLGKLGKLLCYLWGGSIPPMSGVWYVVRNAIPSQNETCLKMRIPLGLA